MTDTQRRIQAYQASLPGLKERVVAVALLLAMSLAMMTSASFAWLTISRSPEVTGLQTNVASNGSLEIALASGYAATPTEPNASQVGDSSESQKTTLANLTWGNLINLSDPSYGLAQMTLRPAELNESDLLEKPLYGAVYRADGRIEKMTDSFRYTEWVEPQNGYAGRFEPTTELGVRAISSTKMSIGDAWVDVIEKRDEITETYLQAGGKYIELTQNKEYMESLAFLMGTFMTDRLNSGSTDDSSTNVTISKTHLGNLVAMYEAFVEVFELEALGMVQTLNLQLHMLAGGEEVKDPYSVASMLATSESALLKKGMKLEGLDRFKKDYNQLKSDYEVLKKLNAVTGTVKWNSTRVKDDGTVAEVVRGSNGQFPTGGRSMKSVLSSLVDPNSCTLEGIALSGLGMGQAMNFLNKERQKAVITNGLIYEFEKRTGARMDVGPDHNNGKGLLLQATAMGMNGKIYAYISTSAPLPATYKVNQNYTLDMSTEEFEGEEWAEDTYGMAIDLWVRTNALGSFLILEGNVLTSEEEVRAVGKDRDGNLVELYVVSRLESVETGEVDPDTGAPKVERAAVEYNLYKGGEKWYKEDDHTEFQLNEGETPLPKMEIVTTVIGYEGVNRVWDEESHDFLSVDSTTQGSGSCYIYYADTPEDQARAEKLLESFKVAFVDERGVKLAQAEMDTKQTYEEGGRFIVPLKLSITESVDLGEVDGVKQYAITALEQDVPTLITAIVYLDGTTLTNDEVLSAASIQGQLNIQFGSSQTLQPIENESLASKELRVSASVDKTSFDYATHVGPMISTVTLNVIGDEPREIKAFFLRQISETQGSREDEMIFEKNAEGKWEAQYTFTSPGKYVLRSVELDGITRNLAEAPVVNIEGFSVRSLSCEDAVDKLITILSAENSRTVELELQFAANDAARMPNSVQGRFLRDDDGSAVNISFALDPSSNTWKGKATFLTSGDYTLQYLVIDGQYESVPASLQLKADVTLGMRVSIWTTSPTMFEYVPEKMTEEQKNLRLEVIIKDNAGDEMTALQDAKLYYCLRGAEDHKMSTDLTWNASKEQYEGVLVADEGAGIWVFEKVTIGGGNTLTKDAVSPTFTLIPPDPPALVDNGFVAESYQLRPNGGAFMDVKLSNASTAVVEANVTNKTSGKSYSVLGTLQKVETIDDVEICTFRFVLPSDTVTGKDGVQRNNVQDGEWVMNHLDVRGYFDAAGNLISGEKDENGNYVAKPMVIHINSAPIKVVQSVTLELVKDDNRVTVFGKTGGEVTSAFLTTHKDAVQGLQATLRDYDNKSVTLKDGTGIVMKFTYDDKTEMYGGYASDDVTNLTEEFEVTLMADEGDATRFNQTDPHDLTYAGNYTCTEITFTVGNEYSRKYTYTGSEDDLVNQTKKLPDHAPSYTVWSKGPTLMVTGVGPTGTLLLYAQNVPKGGGPVLNSDNISGSNSYTDYYATVYPSAKSSNKYSVVLPEVTLKLSGMVISNFTATATFPTQVTTKEDGNAASPVVYQFTQNNQAVKKTIGEREDGFSLFGQDKNPRLYPIGKQPVTQISVTYGGKDFLVNLTQPVTIDNQANPPYLSFNSTASGVTLQTTPDRLVGQIQEDKTFKVTLPAAQTWTVNNVKNADGEFVKSGNAVTTNGYTVQDGGCDPDTYTAYTLVTTTYVAESSKTTWTSTHTITGWKIGSTVYAPGETITITTKQTVTAVLSSVDGAKTTTTTTATKQYLDYTEGSSGLTSKPTGSDWSNADRSDHWTEVTYN